MPALIGSRVKKLYAAATLCSLALVFACPDFLFSQPFPVPEGSRCSECGMSVDRNSKFSVEAIAADGKKLFFCDIGDMLVHFKSGKEKLKTVYVKDYIKGEWIDGKKAFYVLDKKYATPMSWHIATFGEESEARKWGSPVDFNGAFKLLK